jgi:energy-coupling factor transporter ATP-binding protein EcfA2
MQKGIILDHVTFHYPGKSPVLSDISLSIAPGMFVGITGVNGSGKSTFTYLLNGLIPHSIPGVLSGTVHVDGVDTKKKSVGYFSSAVGMVFQNPDFSLFTLTVAEEIRFGLKNLYGKTDPEKIKSALKLVGLEGYASRNPQTLSFGEKQKVCLASVLALDVSYIILDEPTAMLDYKSSLELYRLLQKLHTQGKTIITVEHDTDLLWEYTQESIVIHHGKVTSMGPTRRVLSNHKLLHSLGIKKPHGVKI